MGRFVKLLWFENDGTQYTSFNIYVIILTAIGGGFGAYAINFLQKNSNYGYVFAMVFILISIAIFVTYVKLNTYIRTLEEI